MSFDEEAVRDLLDVEIEDDLDTVFPLHPEGDFDGVLSKPDLRGYPYEDKESGEEKVFTKFFVTVSMDEADPEFKAAQDEMGMKPRIRHSINIDRTEDGGIARGKGKNIQLGRLREAVGQNVKGEPWSFRMLDGQPIRYRVKHRPHFQDKERQEAYIAAVGPVGEDL